MRLSAGSRLLARAAGAHCGVAGVEQRQHVRGLEQVEVVREGRRVYVRMHGLEYVGDDELPRRSLGREDKLQRTVWELDRTVTELERKRDVAREAALASRQVHKELEEAYRKETAAHKETKDLLNVIRVIAIVLFVLLVGSVLVWWFVLR